MAIVGAIEKKEITYGLEKTGRWELVPEEDWQDQVVMPNRVYELKFLVPDVPLLNWLPWFWLFKPEQYVAKLREDLAGEMQVSTDEIDIPWFSYDPETRQLKVQIQHVPGQAGPTVAALPLVLFGVAGVIVAVTMFITMFGAIFTQSPILIMIKQLLEELADWLEKLKPIMKYGLYIVIAGGGIWLTGKMISKLGKRRAKG